MFFAFPFPLGGLLAVLAGAFLGSWVNVFVYRLRRNLRIIGRSHCPECLVQLKPRHLVPVLSWLALRGRCAFCQRRIHIQYPIVELLGALFVLIAFLRHADPSAGLAWQPFLFESALSLVLLTLATFDLRWQLLPIELMCVAAIVFGFWNVIGGRLPWTSVALGGTVGLLILGVQVLLSRGRWLGEGDPWLGLLMGLALGWPGVGFALYLTYIVGGLLMTFLWLVRLVKRGQRIPFAPMLAAGTLMALWYGEKIWRLIGQ